METLTGAEILNIKLKSKLCKKCQKEFDKSIEGFLNNW